MKLINDNLKKTSIFNSILIVIALVLRVMNVWKMSGIAIVDTVVCVLCLLFGLLYCLNGYKKDVAKYYKYFMYLFVLDCIISFATIFVLFGLKQFNQIGFIHGVHIAILICACLLAFVKDFGEHNSKTAACIILVLNSITLFNDLINGLLVTVNYGSLAFFIQSIIVYVLVSQKYADKASRGTI